MNNQFNNQHNNDYFYLDSDYPPDTTTVASKKQTSRTWGIPGSEIKNILDIPQSSNNYDDGGYSKVFSPSMPQHTITRHDNLISGRNNLISGRNNLISVYDSYSGHGGNDQYEAYDEDEYDGHDGHDGKSVSKIPVLPVQNSIFSIMSNLCYGKMVQHFDNKYNHVYSPYSLYYIAMCALVGSTGDTFTQLANMLGIVKPDIVPSIVEDCLSLYRHITQQPNVKINVMNGFFMRKSFQPEIMSTYIEFAKKIGQLKPLDFSNKSASIEFINNWVKDGTRGLIPNLLNDNSIDNMTMMVVVNVIYFKSTWQNKFEKLNTKAKPFHKSNGLEVSVPMMFQSEKFHYMEDSKFQMVTLPYNNPNFVMHVILPQPNNDQFPVQNIHNFLESYITHMKKQTVDLYLPKFTQKTKQKLNDCFKKLGVRNLFNQTNAELFGIAKPTNGQPLYVSDITQEAIIIVDEEGTEAAAATMMTMMRNCASPVKTVVFNAK